MRKIEDQFSNMQLNEPKICLAFANTANWHTSAHPIEELPDAGSIITWAQVGGLVDSSTASKLLDKVLQNPAEATKFYKKAIQIREAIYQIFSKIAHSQPVSKESIFEFNTLGMPILRSTGLISNEEQWILAWMGKADDLDQLVWPMIQSTLDLLISDDRSRVGQCADDRGCGWLFFDQSKNKTRQWCTMRDCGNRAKARRHYRKKQAQN